MTERVSSEMAGVWLDFVQHNATMTRDEQVDVLLDLLDARRERDEAREELASEGRWRDTYQLKVIELERQLTATNKALDTAKQFIEWLWGEELNYSLGDGDVQEKLDELGMLDRHKPEPGSPEAEDWGEDEELYYLKAEWKPAGHL